MNRHIPTWAGRILFAAATLGFATASTLRAEPSHTIVETYPGAAFETTTPEAAGWSAEKFAEAKSWSQQVAPTAAGLMRFDVKVE